MIALKWTKETNVNIVAGNWQAGYTFGQIDAATKYASQLQIAKEALEKIIAKIPEGCVHEAGKMAEEIETIANEALSSLNQNK